MNFDTRLLRHVDKLLLLATVALITVGVIVISSAARGFIGEAGASGFVNRQVIAAGLGVLVLIVILFFDYSEFGRMSLIIYGVNVALLLLVLVLGTTVNGAKSWIQVGGLQIQPGEYAKVMLILTLGHHLSKLERIHSVWDLVVPGLHVLPLLGLIMLEPDLGTALVCVVIAATMIYMAGFPGWKLALLGGSPVGAVGIWFWTHLKYGVSMKPLQDHQVKRIRDFLDPTADPLGSGYQVMQSKISIGSGGFWGKGLYQGTQNQLGFLPEQHTDFIFSVIGEELGFVGGAAVILLFLLLLWRVMTISATAKDRYGMLIATGVTAMIGFHVLENVGMTMGIMPVTGIPLPFVSYGGSSLIANIIAIALVLNVGMRRHTIMF